MKRYFGSIAACVLAAVITLSSGPAAVAASRADRGRDGSAPIVRILKQLQKFFGIGTQDSLPLPPRPEPTPVTGTSP